MLPADFDRSSTGANALPDPGVDPKELLAILWRRRWIILATVVIVTALAVFMGLRVTPEYTAKALLVIDPNQVKVVNAEAVVQGLSTDPAAIETQITMIESHAQLTRVMERLDLFHDPEFNPALAQAEGGMALAVGRPLDALLGWLPGEWLIATGLAHDAAAPTVVAEMPREAAIERFADGLSVAQEGRSNAIALSFTSVDPDKAARIVNALAELYVDNQLAGKVAGTRKAVDHLGDRVVALRAVVQQAEQAVEDYRKENNLVSTEGVSLRERNLAEVSRELIGVRTRLAEQQAKLDLIRELRARGGRDLDTVDDVIGSQVIINLRQQEAQLNNEEAELKTQFGARHPRMLTLLTAKQELQAKVQREVDRIATALENEVGILRTKASSIAGAMEQLKQETVADNEATVRLRALEREAQASRQLYESFLDRFKETREQEGIVEADTRVISPAVAPVAPSTRGAKLFGALGFTASLALGGLLALLREWFDDTIRSTRQVERSLGVGVLALVPRLKRPLKPHRYLLAKPISAYTEAIRSIDATLRPATLEKRPKVFLITSALPEEGKTTLALSLATYVASCGQRALLVDLDLRHPSVHRELGVTPKAGLGEFLTGSRTFEEVLAFDQSSGVWFLPVRRQTIDPVTLLGSQRLRALIQELQASFDLVILDSAPLLGVTDTKVVVPLAEKVVLAARWGSTTKNAADHALGCLREAGGAAAGIVITQVDLRRHASDRYGDVGQYYGKYHKYYVN